MFTAAKQETKVNGQKQECRIFTDWGQKLDEEKDLSFLSFFRIDKLKRLHRNNQVIKLRVSFDYNYKTFIPKEPPKIVSIDDDCMSNDDLVSGQKVHTNLMAAYKNAPLGEGLELR